MPDQFHINSKLITLICKQNIFYMISAGHSEEIQRAMADASKLQLQNKALQEKYKKALQEMANIVQANRQLKNQIDSLQSQRQHQIDNLILQQKQYYQGQMQRMVKEKQSLASQLQTTNIQISNHLNDKTQLQSEITQLRSENRHNQLQRNSLKREFQNIKSLLTNPQSKAEIADEIIKMRKQMQQIHQISAKNAQLQQELRQSKLNQETSKHKITQLQTQISTLEKSLFEQKQKVIQKSNLISLAEQKHAFELIDQAARLRKEMTEIKNKMQSDSITNASQKSSDQELIHLLKQFHQQLSTLRYETNEHKNKKNYLVEELVQIKSEFHLASFKAAKEIEYFKQENAELKARIQQQLKLKKFWTKEQRKVKELEEEREILEGRLYVLEAINIAERHRKAGDSANSIKQFQRRISLLLAEEHTHLLKNQTINSIQDIIALKAIIKELDQRITLIQNQKETYLRKYQAGKEKIAHLNTKINENEAAYHKRIEHFKHKIQGYDQLCVKYRIQLEKFLNFDINSTESEQIIHTYQNRYSLLMSEFKILQKSSKESEQRLMRELDFEKQQFRRLYEQHNNLKLENMGLIKKYRESESIQLQQQLKTMALQSNKNFQKQAMQKGKMILKLQEQLRLLQLRHAQQKQRLSADYRLNMNRLQRQIQSLKERRPQIQTDNTEIQELKRKIYDLSKTMQSKNTQNQNSYISSLISQINSLKEERLILNNQIFQLKNGISLQQKSTMSINSQLQGYLKQIYHLKNQLNLQKDKQLALSAEILRLNQELELKSMNNRILTQRLQNSDKRVSQDSNFQLANTLNQMKQTYEHYQQDNEELTLRIRQLQEKISAIKREYDALYLQNINLIDKPKEAQGKLNNLKSSFMQLQKQKEEIITEKDREILQLQNALSILRSQCQQLDHLYRQLRQQRQPLPTVDSTPNELQSLRIQIHNKDKQIEYYKSQIERILHQRMYQKQNFQAEWNKLVYEIETYRSTIYELEQRNAIPTDLNDQFNKINAENLSLRMNILNINREIEIKEDTINDLKNKLYAFELQGYSTEERDKLTADRDKLISSLQQENHSLRQIRYKYEDQIRHLQQQLNLLAVKKQIESQPIQNQPHNSNSMQNSQLRKIIQDREEFIELVNAKMIEKVDQQRSVEELLLLLCLSFAQIQSLRDRMQIIQLELQNQLKKYHSFLQSIESKSNLTSNEVNFELIKDIQCAHNHLLEFSQKYLQTEQRMESLLHSKSMQQSQSIYETHILQPQPNQSSQASSPSNNIVFDLY